MNQAKISLTSKILLIISAVLLVISIFVPIWRIELDAPQYPEGLNLLIYSNALGGNVEIINGLNHYIGMKTLHAEEFIEFKVLPYIIAFFAVLSLVVAFIGKRKFVYLLLLLFVCFGVIAMIDFWRWEYNYGHHLNPNAAIIVPGMAYQPPLIGFKQLLNFGAYSIPDIGGWLFITSGCFMLLSTIKEFRSMKKYQTSKVAFALVILMTFFISCVSIDPEPIQLNKDHCDFCKMTISNGHLAAELKTKKGRTYKFDDLECMLNYVKQHSALQQVKFYVNDFAAENQLIDAEHAYFIYGEAIASPMGGNIAAFKNKEVALPFQQKFNANSITWSELLK